MSSLTVVEQAHLERFLRMDGGYVIGFSNNSFAQFVLLSVGIDPYDDRYEYGSGSKANRLRSIWSQESDSIVGKLVRDLLEYSLVVEPDRATDPELAVCQRIADRLVGAPLGEDLRSVAADLSGPNFDLILGEVRNAMERNRPEAGLDRLHTFTSKYLRSVCERRGMVDSRESPLHSVMGGYVKKLREEGELRSEMTERILKSAIGTLEAFNKVRNDQSLAHDNELLNYHEAFLIFNQVCGVLRFIHEIENPSSP